MGKFGIEIKPEAKKDLEKHYSGTGQPEQLKYELSRYWSRRINKKDRIVYSVEDHIVTVTIVSALGHYGDKS